jgi:hypothetical protein
MGENISKKGEEERIALRDESNVFDGLLRLTSYRDQKHYSIDSAEGEFLRGEIEALSNCLIIAPVDSNDSALVLINTTDIIRMKKHGEEIAKTLPRNMNRDRSGSVEGVSFLEGAARGLSWILGQGLLAIPSDGSIMEIANLQSLVIAPETEGE